MTKYTLAGNSEKFSWISVRTYRYHGEDDVTISHVSACGARVQLNVLCVDRTVKMCTCKTRKMSSFITNLEQVIKPILISTVEMSMYYSIWRIECTGQATITMFTILPLIMCNAYNEAHIDTSPSDQTPLNEDESEAIGLFISLMLRPY